MTDNSPTAKIERFDPTRYIETSVIRKFRITAADLKSAIDRHEAKRTEDRIRAAIATKETDDELRALRHATSVGLHNGALERAAAAIRSLAQTKALEG